MQEFDGVKVAGDGTAIFSGQTDASLAVRFFMFPVLLEKESEAAGIPKYRDIEMLEVRIAGDRNSVIHRKVKDEDKIRFRNKYENFKSSIENTMEGTLLNQFPFITASQIEEYKHLNIFTAEQLISIPDGHMHKLGHTGRALINKVKAYMESAKDSAFVTKVISENETLKREMELLKKQMQQIMQSRDDEGNAIQAPKKLSKANKHS